MSTTLLPADCVTAHRSGDGAKVRGTVIRLRQFDGLHQRLPRHREVGTVPVGGLVSASLPAGRCPSSRTGRPGRRSAAGDAAGRVAADPHDRHGDQRAGHCLRSSRVSVLVGGADVEVGASRPVEAGHAERLVAGQRRSADVVGLRGARRHSRRCPVVDLAVGGSKGPSLDRRGPSVDSHAAAAATVPDDRRRWAAGARTRPSGTAGRRRRGCPGSALSMSASSTSPG